MANQTQCPHCGGFKADAESVQVDRQTNQEEKYLIPSLWNSTSIIFFPVLWWLYILLIPVDIWNWFGWRKKEKIRMVKYHCQLCGYKWTWRVDQPVPTAHEIKPDLIAKGEQALQEAELRRRRDAEAYQAWQNQQNG